MLADLDKPAWRTDGGDRTGWIDAVALAFAAAIAVAVLIQLSLADNPGGNWLSEARPSVDALLHDRFGLFLRSVPPYGGSLLLRAPFLELTRLWHAGTDSVYAAGAVPCVAAVAAMALWLAHRLALRGGSLLGQVTVTVLCILNPLSVDAVFVGHPEELLGAALCVAAVICALDDRAVLAGVLVGLATANIAWGVLAAGPVLIALSARRPRAFAAMCLVGGGVMAPLVLARSGGVVAQVNDAGASAGGGLFFPEQLWWWVGPHLAGLPVRVAPSWLPGIGHTLSIALMAPLTLAVWVRHRFAHAPRRADALLLLALLLLLRCALDPWDIPYYAVPFVVALLAWECEVGGQLPVLALVAVLAEWWAFTGSLNLLGATFTTQAEIYTLITVPMIIGMLSRLFWPARTPRTVTTSDRGDFLLVGDAE